MKKIVIHLDSFTRNEKNRNYQKIFSFALSVFYFVMSIIFLFELKYFLCLLHGFAGVSFLYSSIMSSNSFLDKYILFSDEKIEIKKSIFKSSMLFWDKIVLIKLNSSSIEFITQNGNDVILSLGWIDYPIVKEIQRVLKEFCSSKNIRIE